ncbi:MAG TPA: flavin reductase family protein [Nitrososphaera sp.]|nr:flavin reductase family protein [Nitrososphaera sp.]
MPGTAIQDNAYRYFATTVALVTTYGKQGQNVMAAEWAMQISYEPMLVAVFIHDSPTLWNIKETGAFGVSVAADDQADLVNIAGGYSGTEISKLAIPHTFQTFEGEYVPMIKGCTLACECKVVSTQEIGDHVMVVGQAISATFDEDKSPLIYTRGSYCKVGAKLALGRKTVRLSSEAFAEFKRMSGGQFVLKAAVAIARDGNKTLFTKVGSSWMLPATVPAKGADYKKALSLHLASMGLQAKIGGILGIERMMLKSGKNSSLRANFVAFSCTVYDSKEKEGRQGWEWFLHPPRNLLLKSLLLLGREDA